MHIPTQLIAFSGGGYRGLFSAKVAAFIEQKLGGPIAKKFDLLAGTSIGGIIAIALALEIPASKIVEVFLAEGENIFGGPELQRRIRDGRFWDEKWPMGMNSAIHDPSYLRLVLEREFFGKKVLGECLHPVIVPAVNFTTATPQLFKTPHHPAFERDHLLPIVDIAMATSAAPVYFPHHLFNHKVYVDGGLIANGPALYGLHEAESFLGREVKDTSALAIGTLEIDSTASGGDRLDKGIRQWGKDLFALTIIAQERGMNQIVEHRLGERYMSLNNKLTESQVHDVSLNLADKQAQQTLLAHADSTYQNALRLGLEARFLKHNPQAPRFYHGPHAAPLENFHG